MNRICIAALMTVMICGPGCGPSEREVEARREVEVAKGEAEIAKEEAEVAKREAEVAKREAEVAKGEAEVAKGEAEVAKGEAEVAKREAKKPTPREAFEATEKLLSAWDGSIKGSKADYIRILISEGADVNAKDDWGWTPLIHAATTTPEIVTLLLKKGAKAKANKGWTPLMKAAMYSSTPEVVTLLIEAGADVNAKDNNGKTPLLLAKTSDVIKILRDAGARGPTQEEAVEAVEATEKLVSAWDKDIKGSRADYFRILISEGADVNSKDDSGRTMLWIAAQRSSLEIVTLLIEKGADVNAKNNNGKTPLSRATNIEIIKLLKAAGAKF
jgi:hypothetical protein